MSKTSRATSSSCHKADLGALKTPGECVTKNKAGSSRFQPVDRSLSKSDMSSVLATNGEAGQLSQCLRAGIQDARKNVIGQLFTMGDVESFESQATRHHRSPSVSRQVGMAVHVKVLELGEEWRRGGPGEVGVGHDR